jgi:hypothetical protein
LFTATFSPIYKNICPGIFDDDSNCFLDLLLNLEEKENVVVG